MDAGQHWLVRGLLRAAGGRDEELYEGAAGSVADRFGEVDGDSVRRGRGENRLDGGEGCGEGIGEAGRGAAVGGEYVRMWGDWDME